MKKTIILIFILAALLMMHFLFDWYLRSVFSVIASEESIKELSNCLDGAVSETITSEINYDELVTIKQDNLGNIVLVQSNTILMNRIAGDVVKKAEEKLKGKIVSGIKIPFGYLIGGQLFGEKFPSITVNFRQIGNVTSDFTSSFSEAGINQTMHTVNLTLNVDALLLIPNNNLQVNTSLTVPVCETIIIGNVPTEYRKYLESSGNEEDDDE